VDDIFTCLYAVYARHQNAPAPYGYCGTRFYRGIAPDGATRPYIVATLVGGSIDWMFGDEQIESARVQFDVVGDFDGNAVNTMRIWAGLVNVLEKATLPAMDGSQFMVLRRDGLPRETILPPVIQISGDWLLERHVTRM